MRPPPPAGPLFAGPLSAEPLSAEPLSGEPLSVGPLGGLTPTGREAPLRRELSGRRPPVDPRFRQRWIEARRMEGRRRLRILLVAFAALSALVFAAAVVDSGVVGVRHVEVLGAAHSTSAVVVAAAAIRPHTPMVRLDEAAVRRRVDALPWVASAKLTRRWPGTVVIAVRERRAVAEVAAGSSFGVTDVTGRVLEVLPATTATALSLPVVEGLAATAPGGQVALSAGVGPAAARQLLRLASLAPPSLVKSGLSLGLQPGVGIVGHLRGSRVDIVFGAGSQLTAKVAALGALMASKVDVAAAASVDLRAPSRPALTPALSTSNVSTVPGG